MEATAEMADLPAAGDGLRRAKPGVADPDLAAMTSQLRSRDVDVVAKVVGRLM
jgi:hypothetical protein